MTPEELAKWYDEVTRNDPWRRQYEYLEGENRNPSTEHARNVQVNNLGDLRLFGTMRKLR